jgi:urease accessory protein
LTFRPARVLGNVRDFAIDGRHVERLYVGSEVLVKRVLRLASSVGDLGLRLEQPIADGDVIFADDTRVIAIVVQADEVLVVRPRTRAEATAVGHALGNWHLPVHYDGDAVIVRYAPVIETLVQGLDVPYERCERRLD